MRSSAVDRQRVWKGLARHLFLFRFRRWFFCFHLRRECRAGGVDQVSVKRMGRSFRTDDERALSLNIGPMERSHRGLLYIGLIALAAGAAFYCFARPQGIVYLQEKLHLRLFPLIPPLPHALAGVFPDFIHPFAFSLIGIALVARTRTSRLFVCASFFSIDLLFEVGQKYKHAIFLIIPPWFSRLPILDNMAPFFLRGTFDLFDIVFMAFGSITAFVVSEIIIAKQVGRSDDRD